MQMSFAVLILYLGIGIPVMGKEGAWKVTLFHEIGMRGDKIVIDYSKGCTPISGIWRGQASSVDAGKDCVLICRQPDCGFDCVQINPRWNDLRDVTGRGSFDKAITAVSCCYNDQQRGICGPNPNPPRTNPGPGIDGPWKVTLFGDTDLKGSKVDVDYSKGCTPVPSGWDNQASSLDPKNCVSICENSNCGGIPPCQEISVVWRDLRNMLYNDVISAVNCCIEDMRSGVCGPNRNKKAGNDTENSSKGGSKGKENENNGGSHQDGNRGGSDENSNDGGSDDTDNNSGSHEGDNNGGSHEGANNGGTDDDNNNGGSDNNSNDGNNGGSDGQGNGGAPDKDNNDEGSEGHGTNGGSDGDGGQQNGANHTDDGGNED